MQMRSATRPVASVLLRAAQAQERIARRLQQPTLGERRAGARAAVGGAWDEMGPLQLEFLQSRGMQPSDHLLDVGCGCLRGGLHLIRYLEPGHYFGIDSSPAMIELGRVELAEAGLVERRPALAVDAKFNFAQFHQSFDIAFAQSVFSHLPLNKIHRCLVNMASVLRPGGTFYATFFHDTHDRHDLSPRTYPVSDGPDVVTTPDGDPFRYNLRFIEDLADGLPLKVELLGEWGSLRGQSMLAFHRA